MEQPVGFFALWKNKDDEYRATEEDEKLTCDQIGQAFANGSARGIKVMGLFNCRWSTDRQYFTFWAAPSLEAVEATIADLERAGDFKFADSEHVLGTLTAGQLTPGAWDKPAVAPPGGRGEIGVWTAWRRKENCFRDGRQAVADSEREVERVLKAAEAAGVRLCGRYACPFSTEYDGFTFWIAPDIDTVERVIDRLEEVEAFKYADTRHVLGVHESFYRFGRHIQV